MARAGHRNSMALSRVSSDKSSREISQSNSASTTEAGKAGEMVQQDRLPAISAEVEPQPASVAEPTWPHGIQPYKALFGSIFLQLNSWGQVNALGTFISYYKLVMLPNMDILYFNLIGGTQSLIILGLSSLVGRLLDARYHRALVIAGTILNCLGLCMLSLVDQEEYSEGKKFVLILLTQGVICGSGMACNFVTSSFVTATWFKKRRGQTVGIVACGASFGGLVYPIMFQLLVPQIGFKNSVLCIAGVVTVTSLLSCFTAVPKPDNGVRPITKWNDYQMVIDPEAFRHPPFLWFTAATCFLFFGFYPISFNLAEWAAYTGLGYNDNIAGGAGHVTAAQEVQGGAIRNFFFLCIMNGCSIVGSLSSAFLCDHFGALNVHAVNTFISSLLVLCLWTQASTIALAIAFVVLFGAISGAVIGLPPASVANILDSDPEGNTKLAQWIGMQYMVAAPFSLAGPVIGGHLITEYNQNYLTVQCWSGGNLFVCFICILGAIYCKRKCDAAEQKNKSRQASSEDMEMHPRDV